VANEKALALLNTTALNHLRDALNQSYGTTLTSIPINLNKKDAQHLSNRTAYTAPYPPPPLTPTRKDITPIRQFQAAWTPTDFIYTDGSQIKGNPSLGALVVDPLNDITNYIEIKSQPERHTINRAELAAITTTLDLYRHAPTLSIFTENAFSINNLKSFASQPHTFNNHQHKDQLATADTILRQRDVQGHTTHIGKVKSHTGVKYNDATDEWPRNVVEGQKTPDIIFTAADPPIGRLRTWPQTRNTKPDNPMAHAHHKNRRHTQRNTENYQNTTISHSIYYNYMQ
jgi:ribonuclease HI